MYDIRADWLLQVLEVILQIVFQIGLGLQSNN